MRVPPIVSSVVLCGLFACAAGCRGKPANDDPPAAPASSVSASPRDAAADAIDTVGQTRVSGTLRSEGGELGTWDVVLADCHSGERDGFYGAEFYVAGSTEMRLRYIHDEAVGDIVKVADPSKNDAADAVVRFDRDACTVLDGSIQKTNHTTWTPKGKIRHVSGHVKLDCKTKSGKGHVTGDVTFVHCH